MTDEQLFAYIDAYSERIADEVEAEFASAVEAVRAGSIFAHNDKQYRTWRRKRARSSTRTEPVGLTGQALEKAVMGYAAMTPEYVIRGGTA